MHAKTPSRPHAARWGLALAAAGVVLGASPAVASHYSPVKLLFLALGAAWAWVCLVLAVSLSVLSVQGGPDKLAEAEQAFDRATKLDRSLPGLLESRIKVARIRKDEAKAKELEASLAALLLLTDR